MENKIICIHCLNEIDSSNARCPNCGNGTIRSQRVFEYLKRQERRNEPPSAEFITRRFSVYPSAARKILEAYYSGGSDKRKPELNAFIKKIRVEELFDYLDYSIDFNAPTSIIIAPNGFGKTTIFNFINFMLYPDLEVYSKHIKGIPFKKFEITLKNDVILTLEKGEEEGQYKFYASNVDGDPKDINIPFENSDIDDIPNRPIDGAYYTERMIGISKMNELLAEAGISSEVFFIKTSRAFIQPELLQNYAVRTSAGDESDKPVDPIIACNDELFKLVLECRSKYQKLVEKAKITVPDLFLKESDPSMPYDVFKKEWDEYNNQLNKLISYGLIDKESAGLDLSHLNEAEYRDKMLSKGTFLSIYVTQYKETLAPFNELWKKMYTFKNILDERNRDAGKSIKYTPNGISYFNGAKQIKLDNLSSGEKNDFIMFFDLIFRTRQGTIVLIDEPEISLHINWQERFIDNIERALLDKHCQVIISTHSPDIISVHDDLLAEININNRLKETDEK